MTPRNDVSITQTNAAQCSITISSFSCTTLLTSLTPSPYACATFLAFVLLVSSGCRVSDFEDADVRRLIQNARQLRTGIAVDSDALKSNFTLAQEALSRLQDSTPAPPPTPLDPLISPPKEKEPNALTPLLKTALTQCFQEPAVDRSFPELAERLTTLSEEETVAYLCNADAFRALQGPMAKASLSERERALQHLSDVLLLRDLLKATIPQQVYELGQDFLKARTLRSRLSSRADSLPLELPPLDDSGEAQLANLQADLVNEDKDLDTTLKEVEQRLRTVVLIMDETLETTAYEISSFAIPSLP